MTATSEYLNRPVRSLDEVCRDLERRKLDEISQEYLLEIERKLHAAGEFRRAS